MKQLFLVSSLLLLFAGCKENTNPVVNKIEVASHFNGADATVIQVTDQYFPAYNFYVRNDTRKYSAAWAEFLAFQYNIPLHVFEQSLKGASFKGFLITKRGGASIYYPSCYETYRKSKLDSIRNEIRKVYGRLPTTISYGCGDYSYSDSLPNYILGGRTSESMRLKSAANAITWYGDSLGVNYTKDFSEENALLTYAVGGRFYSDLMFDAMPVEKVAAFTKKQVSITVNTNGFYTNFMHWHDYSKDKEGNLIEGVTVMESLFDAMNKGLKDGRNSYLDYNEALEYLYAKEAVDSVVLVENNKKELKIRISHTKKRTKDYSVIETPVSIKIPKGLLKLNIKKATKQMRVVSLNEDNNSYYINILLDFTKKETTVGLTLGEDRYTVLNLDKKLTLEEQFVFDGVKTNMPANFVLFRRKQGARDFEIELVDRRFNFAEKYKPPQFEEGYDYFCGAIAKTRESAVIQLNN